MAKRAGMTGGAVLIRAALCLMFVGCSDDVSQPAPDELSGSANSAGKAELSRSSEHISLQPLSEQRTVGEVANVADGVSGFDDVVASAEPIAVADVGTVHLEIVGESSYRDEKGSYVVDVIENDYAYLMLLVTSPEGRPVTNAAPTINIVGASQLAPVSEQSQRGITDERGALEFAIHAGGRAVERVDVELLGQQLTVVLNIIGIEALGFAALDQRDDVLRWRQLQAAQLRYRGERLLPLFPSSIEALDGKAVRLIGFMMPLEASMKVRHFLLTANPPSCFFHVPGGPAGAVEVRLERGIEPTWEPLVLEGKLRLIRESDSGVIYQLQAAHKVE